MILRAYSQNKFTAVSVTVVSDWFKSNSFWFYQQNPSSPRTCHPIPLIPVSYLLQTPSCKSQKVKHLVKAVVSLQEQSWIQATHRSSTFGSERGKAGPSASVPALLAVPPLLSPRELHIGTPRTKHCYPSCLREYRLHLSLHMTLTLMIGLLLTTPKSKSCPVLLLRYSPVLFWRARCWKAVRSGSVFDSWVERAVSILNVPMISCLNWPKNKAEAPVSCIS